MMPQHRTALPSQNNCATTPSLVFAQAHTLAVTSDGTRLLWWNGEDKVSATISSDDTLCTLLIHNAIHAPVIIDQNTDKNITIRIERDATAHLVIRARHTQRIELMLAAHAQCHVYVIPEADHHLDLNAQVHEHAHLSLFEFGLDAKRSLRTMAVTLANKKAAISYFGLDQLSGHEHKKAHLVITHRGQETTSSQWFRGIYGGASYGDFLGQVVIEKTAGGSSARQLYKSIVLSEKAKAHAKPELVIFNHDISASHGATIGELDHEALFYLCSRGLPLHEAKALLIESFIEEALLTIEHPVVREALATRSAQSTAHLLGDCL